MGRHPKHIDSYSELVLRNVKCRDQCGKLHHVARCKIEWKSEMEVDLKWKSPELKSEMEV